LAKAYVHTDDGAAGDRPLLENVTRVTVEGDRVRLTSLLGEVEEVSGRITSIDFVEGKLAVERVRA
jgi:predicted RNA-binding protein